MRKVTLLLVMLVVLALGIGPVLAQEDSGTIADVVVASAGAETPEFSTLLAAVQAADPAVLEALSDPEAEFTVFAPTDAAFADLAEALGEEAFNAVLADPAALASILTYHVIEGRVMSADVVAALEENEGSFSVPTLNGQYITISQGEMGDIYVDDAMLNLDMLDIEASNGVIHVINSVILPESRTLAEVVVDSAGDAEAPEFAMLLAAVQAADPAVLEALSDPEAELTVFAPTDAAFEALGEDTLNAVLADPAMLTSILLYHVVPGTVYSDALAEMLTEEMLEVETAQGSPVTFEVTEEGGITINGANIIATDINTANGVIHVIDAVILPPTE